MSKGEMSSAGRQLDTPGHAGGPHPPVDSRVSSLRFGSYTSGPARGITLCFALDIIRGRIRRA